MNLSKKAETEWETISNRFEVNKWYTLARNYDEWNSNKKEEADTFLLKASALDSALHCTTKDLLPSSRTIENSHGHCELQILSE